MRFALLPDLRAQDAPDALCIADDTVSLSNAEFLTRVRAAAASLRRRGIRSGDVVAVMLPNRVDLVVALFAAWRLGAAVTPVNPALTATEAAYQIADSAARVVIRPDETPPDPDDAPGTDGGPGLGADRVGTDELLRGVEESADLAAPADDTRDDADATALLIYTSGTTGRPKGVILSHANLSAMATMMIETSRLREDEHSLLVLPLFHVNGIVVGVLSPLLVGGRVTIAGRFKAETFFRTVEAVRPTCFSAVPAIYAMLAALPESERPDTSSVRFAACGAAPMPAELIERIEGRYGFPVLEGYGLSEGTCASTVNPIDGPRKPGTVGLPMPGQDVAVMDASGRLLPPGSTGEVVVRGPNVMRGYLNRPEETARTVIDGWLHTGDVGRFDEDGYLVLVDRIKDVIIRGGENIYPKEIESVLHGHPEVFEAAVVGGAHPVFGEVPVAFVSLRADATVTPEELVEHCRRVLARHKLPERVITLEHLPKNPVGKIDKPTLRTQVTSSPSPAA
ncbi:AMP-binding protein [Streptomyces sp. NA02950]|uniref:class I adenylate-forming enzyme family protein n=1 Tax=Streptomyces sp. NA02950 TaxID=2742137 RepID=UPI0015917BA2|nr:AMP-binding protein [Streptomyces sp. NA02950]QKV90641.1 AMP-binding protein [Streptomyces sp. NA02950]